MKALNGCYFLLVHPCEKDESPCKNEGVCEKNGDEFVCKCDEDWTGTTCEEKGKDHLIISDKVMKILK